MCWPLDTPWIEEDENGLLSVAQPFELYQWWVDGEPIPGATNAVYQTTGPGLYAVSATDYADCPGAISEDWLVVEVQETVEAEFDRCTVYPNPTAAQLTFDLPANASGYKVQVVAMNGRLVDTAAVHSGTTIDVSHWASGTYILRVESRTDGKWLPAVRVIKQ